MTPDRKGRQHRKQPKKRAKRAAQRRKLLIGLAVAAAVLIGCSVMLITRGPSAGQGETTETTAPSTTIHFVAGGDLNITDGVVAAGGSRYDYTRTFMDVAHLLADADLAALNLEGNLCGAPYGADSAPVELAQALDRAGVDLVQLANSYSISRGLSGLAQTINNIRYAGMEPLGVYPDQEQARQGKGYTICNVNGIKVGVVAFTKGMDGLALPANGKGCVNVLYTDYDSVYQTVDTAGISAVMDELNKEAPDITIAMLHWGSEYNDTISASQKKIVSLLQQKGADAIVGTHSHYVQKMEYDPETGAFVAYSLGDFFGDVPRAGTEYSVLLDLEITKDHATGKTKITGYSYTPIFSVTQDGVPDRVMRIHEAMAAYEAGHIDAVSKGIYDDMAYALTRIKARVAGE